MRYPAYPCSAAPDASPLPAGWQKRRLKFVATCNDEVLAESTSPDYEISYVEISGVALMEGVHTVEEMTFEKAPSRARRVARSGDTIVSTVRTYLKAIASIKSAPDNLVVSTGFAVLRPLPVNNSAYLGYALQGSQFVQAVVANSTGVSYPAIAPTTLITLPILYPNSPSEQEHIANFLDWKTGQIDALIAKRQRLVDALREQRESLTFHIATQGLRSAAPLRDSGIPWAPQIPSHWRSGNIRRFATMKTGHTPSRSDPSYWLDCEIPWFTLADVWQLRDGSRTYLGDTKEKISRLGLANSAAELLPKAKLIKVRRPGWSGGEAAAAPR